MPNIDLPYKYQVDLVDGTHYLRSAYPLSVGNVIQMPDASRWCITGILLFVWKDEIGSGGASPLLSVARVEDFGLR